MRAEASARGWSCIADLHVSAVHAKRHSALGAAAPWLACHVALQFVLLHAVPVTLAMTVVPAVALVGLTLIPYAISGVNCSVTAPVLFAARPNASVTVTMMEPAQRHAHKQQCVKWPQHMRRRRMRRRRWCGLQAQAS